MADTKLSGLPSGASIGDADLFYSDQGGNSVSQRASAFTTYLSGKFTSMPWINVKNFGATGNGSTDDTSSINLAIASFNTATNGTLYFPAGTYKTTGSLTAITANGIIRGDGTPGVIALSANTNPALQQASTIQLTANSVPLFTINSQYLTFYDIGLQSTATSTPVSGSTAILVTSSYVGQSVHYSNIGVFGFYISIDIKVGFTWTMFNVMFVGPQQYGVRINNTINSDSGDWSITNAYFWGGSSGGVYTNAAAAIRIEGSGGGKIHGMKLNSGQLAYGVGIDIIGNSTVDLNLVNSSIENFTGVGLNINGSWPNIIITNVEFGSYNFTATSAIKVRSSSGLAISDIVFAGSYSGVLIDIDSTVTNCSVSNLCNTTSAAIFGASAANLPSNDSSGGIGGNVFFVFNPSNLNLVWTASTSSGNVLATKNVNSAGYNIIGCINDAGNSVILQMDGSAVQGIDTAGQGQVSAGGTQLNVISDGNNASGGTHDVSIRPGGYQNSNETLRINHTGSVVQGKGSIATNATDGFMYVTTCAGTPTGTPTSVTGRSPFVFDTTNNKLWYYNGAWKGVVLS